jgi:hypothetical protein
MTSENENPFEPQADKPEDKPKAAPKPKLVVRRSRWADQQTLDYVRPVPGFLREFGK